MTDAEAGRLPWDRDDRSAVVEVVLGAPSKDDARVVKRAVQAIPALRRRQRSVVRTILVAEVVGMVGLGILAVATGSNPALVVGSALVVGYAGLRFGERSILKRLFRPVSHRFDPGGFETLTHVGLRLSMAWGPELDLVVDQGLLVAMAGDDAVLVLGGHRVTSDQFDSIVALAEAGGSRIPAPG